MQLGQCPLFAAVFVGNPHTGIDGPLTQALVFGIGVNLGDDHVAAIPVPTLQVAPAGGVVLNWRNDLEKVPAYRHEVVLQTKGFYARVNIAAVDAQDASQIINNLLNVLSHQTNLSKLNRHRFSLP
jgi:hypothetical protein